MARSPYRVRTDFHVLARSGMIKCLVPIDGTGYQSREDGLHSESSAVEFVLPSLL